MDIPFIFIAQKEGRMMVICKLNPGQKHLYYTANTTLSLWKHMHGHHDDAKLAKKQS